MIFFIKDKRLIHLVKGEYDSVGYVSSCCDKDVLIKFSSDTKRGVTCKDCLKEDKKNKKLKGFTWMR